MKRHHLTRLEPAFVWTVAACDDCTYIGPLRSRPLRAWVDQVRHAIRRRSVTR